MRQSFTLTTPAEPAIRLRTIGAADIEALRTWKNAHREAFFFKAEITSDMQQRWFRDYLGRPDDFMFVIETVAGAPIGCVGVRRLEGVADVYNLILGDPAQGGRGYMGVAMRLTASFGLTLCPQVGLKVMSDNPAVAFHEKQGFVITARHPDHYEMTLDLARFQPLPFTRDEQPA